MEQGTNHPPLSSTPVVDSAEYHTRKKAAMRHASVLPYMKTRILLLATTQYNAAIWKSQLQALQDVENVEVLNQPACS
jgi:hypothetical protein